MRISSDIQSTVDRQPVGMVSPRLVNAAQEFEAQMMKELMKPMTSHQGFDGQEADAAGNKGAGEAWGEFASEALAGAISRNGGFGIAERIVLELSRSRVSVALKVRGPKGREIFDKSD